MNDVWVDKHRLMINESDLQRDRERLCDTFNWFLQNKLAANDTYPHSWVLRGKFKFQGNLFCFISFLQQILANT